MTRNIFYIISIIGFTVFACAPDRDDDFHLASAPEEPAFSVEMVQGDSNRFVIKDLTTDSFQRLWELTGGTPKVSSRVIDTIFYAESGQYTVTLYVSASDGGGTASSSKIISVLKDAPLECTPKFALLTGDCGAGGKCWTFTTAGGAVKVGPTYMDFSWYTSPVNGLQAAQYDDSYCFNFNDLTFENRNNGQSVNPWNGYQPENLNPGVSEFLFLEGTGVDGKDQLVIPDDQFMGVWDADNVMDIITLTENELVVRMRIRDQNGVPAAEGWFELTFVPR